MRNGCSFRQVMPKNARLIPRREGFTLSIIRGVEAAGYRLSGGRPERATRTPVNIGNRPYRDNGEGVGFPTPLPTA